MTLFEIGNITPKISKGIDLNDFDYEKLLMLELDRNTTQIRTEYRVVEFMAKKYIVGRANARSQIDRKLFVTDYDMLNKIIHLAWHSQTNNTYIAHKLLDKELYLHNYVMNKLTFDGKGQQTTIDHINRIGTDNRRENLREISQTNQNHNQKQKKRTVILPAESCLTSDDIPKNVFYHQPKDNFGDFFEFDIKGTPIGRFRKYSTKSKDVSLKFKLQEIKKYIDEFYAKYPELLNLSNTEKSIELIKSYNEIIKLSSYDGWENYIVAVPEPKIEQHVELTEKEKLILVNNTLDTVGKKRTKNAMSSDCGVTKNMIPKYCYYTPASKLRSDCFVIDKHPLLIKQTGKTTWRTTSVKTMSTKDKFDLLLKKLAELEQNENKE